MAALAKEVLAEVSEFPSSYNQNCRCTRKISAVVCLFPQIFFKWPRVYGCMGILQFKNPYFVLKTAFSSLFFLMYSVYKQFNKLL